MKNDSPIGVFDSGMGGLTVLRELITQLPQESFIYLGDTARLPYGTKSAETIRHYAEQITAILIKKNIKLLVVACNTATSAALPYLRKCFPSLPILGVIEPGAIAAIDTTKNNRIAVLATEATINSGIYEKTIQSFNPEVQVISQSCGLFVALAEEGCVDDDIAKLVVKKYLSSIKNNSDKIDCVLLGCTHFPVLESIISEFLGPTITIVNSAKTTATAVKKQLDTLSLNSKMENRIVQFLVTDLPERFTRIGPLFLGRSIHPDCVMLTEY